MKETFLKIGKQIKEFWKSRSGKQKATYISLAVGFILISSVTAYLTSRTTLVPLYSELSPTETGSIKENLDGRGIESEITNGGSTILVPSELADTLLVELAAEGIPKSGNIDYSYFSENASFGMTDNEFNVIKQDAMQNEIAGLIKGIEGVQDAEVILTLPQEGVFVSDTQEDASASIVLNTKPGQEFEESQIQALYHLVSKSVPNLPTDNIVIMNQYFEYFDIKNEGTNSSDSFASQNKIKKEIEKDLQRRVQSMLGTIMGSDKVVVSVTADIDFTKENREENLVEPVDEENMEGLTISAQKLSETYTGNAGSEGGTPVTEDPSDSLGSQYLEGANGDGDYEKTEETVNTEVNRIRKEISESPYRIRDLGIQIMVEPPEVNDTNSLPEERIADIKEILGTIVRTSIDKSENEDSLTDEQLEEKIAISVQPFNGKKTFDEQSEATIPWWIYAIGAVLCLAIIILFVFLIKSRRYKEVEIDEIEDSMPPVTVTNIEEAESEAVIKRKQLEKLAKEKPEEFAKLLRSWITEE